MLYSRRFMELCELAQMAPRNGGEGQGRTCQDGACSVSFLGMNYLQDAMVPSV